MFFQRMATDHCCLCGQKTGNMTPKHGIKEEEIKIVTDST